MQNKEIWRFVIVCVLGNGKLKTGREKIILAGVVVIRHITVPTGNDNKERLGAEIGINASFAVLMNRNVDELWMFIILFRLDSLMLMKLKRLTLYLI